MEVSACKPAEALANAQKKGLKSKLRNEKLKKGRSNMPNKLQSLSKLAMILKIKSLPKLKQMPSKHQTLSPQNSKNRKP